MSNRQLAIYLVIIGALVLVIAPSITPRLVDNSTRAEDQRIVVFPFVSMDSRADSIAVELTDGLVSYLESTPGIEVVSVSDLPPDMRSSDSHNLWPKDGPISLAVEGSVTRRGDFIRAHVQLLRPGRGGHLWAEAFESDTDDMRAILEPVQRRIVAQASR